MGRSNAEVGARFVLNTGKRFNTKRQLRAAALVGGRRDCSKSSAHMTIAMGTLTLATAAIAVAPCLQRPSPSLSNLWWPEDKGPLDVGQARTITLLISAEDRFNFIESLQNVRILKRP